MATSNIEIQDLNITFNTKFGDVRAVKNASIAFESNRATGIIGESGSGKSLLAMSILKLLPPEASISGACIYNEKNLFKLGKKDIRNIRGKEIAFVPQNPINAMNPVLTIGRQLIEHTVMYLGISKREARNLCEEYITAFGLENPHKIMKSYSFQLSGGMNQVVLFIMGIICKPSFIIADEPTKGLDSKIRKNVYDNLLRIKQSYVKSMVIISHDLYFANKICDVLIVMYRGEIVEIGKSYDIINNPRHPYTKKLVKSTVKNGMIPIKKIDEKTCEEGCSFYSYCLLRTEKCIKDIKLNKIDEARVRCAIYD